MWIMKGPCQRRTRGISIKTKITILYDKDTLREDLSTGWGFSCLVERGAEKMLFDTGWDGDTLIANATKLGIDLHKVTSIFISHSHWDHAGGLPRLLMRIDDPVLFVPHSMSERLKDEMKARARVIEVLGEMRVGEGLYSTGEMGKVEKEQSLLIEVEGGWAILTGCAHQGLENIIAVAEKKGAVKAVVGGFHGFKKLDALRSVEELYPCHCTVHGEDIKKRYPERTRSGGVGTVIDL
jgi:7,8-dihydropterin-6-yl-methyl-4-(beta-D-ribofuranosyl)aminobenzene 5'-phosphate synthase